PAGLSVRTEWSADVRSPERVYGPVDLSVKTVQAAGEESHIYMFVHPSDLTHYDWSIQKKKGTDSWCFHGIWISIRSQIANR
ncbi:unnamed protein product, partial [Callosobruchus maculatus]